MTRGRRTTIVVIFVLAIITGFGAITATWVKRQVLDTHNWTNTSSKLLADKKIQQALGTYLVTELFNQAEVSNALSSVLPKQAQPLAAPASAAMQSLALQLAPKILERPRLQEAWRKANEVAHAQLINVIEGGGKNVSTSNGEVALNLRSLVDSLAGQLGVEKQVASARAKLQNNSTVTGAIQAKTGLDLPPDAGKLVILRSDQLSAAQDYANGIKDLSIVLTILSLGLFATAVAIAQDRKRTTLRAVGWSFVGLGLATLLARRIGNGQVIDALVKNESVKPAAHDAWQISTQMLYTIGLSMVIYGVLLVLGAWLVGDQRWAVSTRRYLAPTLADKPGVVYGSVGLVYLLVLAWGPTPAFRNFLPIVLIGALIVIGVEVLRRRTAREFPAAASDSPEPPPPPTPTKPALAG